MKAIEILMKHFAVEVRISMTAKKKYRVACICSDGEVSVGRDDDLKKAAWTALRKFVDMHGLPPEELAAIRWQIKDELNRKSLYDF